MKIVKTKPICLHAIFTAFFITFTMSGSAFAAPTVTGEPIIVQHIGFSIGLKFAHSNVAHFITRLEVALATIL